MRLTKFPHFAKISNGQLLKTQEKPPLVVEVTKSRLHTKAMASKFGGAPKCPSCGKSVFFAERATGPGGDWHKTCLVCKTCKKGLDSTTLAEHGTDVYCKACHSKSFGPKGFGFGGGGAIMHTQ
eukprot:Phypoly_transcript_29756.p2 GENE.Phypoly_transcript_29756~~Phypoly_transcript_29756.p2  ORF type:complete len:131 (+),score=19.18 Phypoly_transcript_29756:22-393(+)